MSDMADLLERFRRGPELLAVLLTGVYGEENDFKTAPEKWSIRQIMAHLADSEMVGATRPRVNEQLRRLAKDGLIDVDRQTITLLRPRELKRRVTAGSEGVKG